MQLHTLSKKLQDFHATPHPTISFHSSRGSDSQANAAPDLPKSHAVGGDQKEQNNTAFDGRTDVKASSQEPARNANHLETVRGTSTGISADPTHPKEFLRPKQHHDFAQETAPSPLQNNKKVARDQERDQYQPNEAASSNRLATAAGMQNRPTARSKPPLSTEPADLRRKVLQSYDRARWESVDSYSPITPIDGGGASGSGGRPNPVRGWSTVLDG